MLTERSRIRLAADVTHQSIGPDEDTVILAFKSGQLYTCNETSAAFLSAADGRKTFGEIVDHLAERYDVGREKLQADLTTLAGRLIEESLLVISSE